MLKGAREVVLRTARGRQGQAGECFGLDRATAECVTIFAYCGCASVSVLFVLISVLFITRA